MKRVTPPHPSPFPSGEPGEGAAAPDDKGPFTAPIDLATFKRNASSGPRQYPPDASTIAPPSGEIGAEPDPFRDFDPFHDENEHADRITITNEVELETARIQSSLLSSLPPPNARSSMPGEPPSLLSMANAQAPTVPPPRDYDSSAKLMAASASVDLASEMPTGEGATVDPIVEMRDRFSLGDYTGALQIAEALLQDDPTNAELHSCAENCRAVLIKMYTARIGPLDKVPIVIVPRHQLRWLSIDHRAGFVLSHIDGMSSLEMVLDVSGMAPLDALRILYELVQQRIIGFR